MSYRPFFKSPDNQSVCSSESDSRERLLSSVVEHTPECVKLVDENGLLLDMNAAGLELIEADCWDSVQNANVYDLIAEEHLDNFCKLNAHVCSGNRGSLEFEIVALKGTRRWMQTTAVPFKLPNGSTVQLAITRDVSKEKKRQQELQQAKEKAEAANIAKSEFLANMSHEIRTPMTAIMGYADILLSTESDPQTKQSAQTIKDNGSYLLQIMNDILDISKIEVGKLDTEVITCSPRTILTEIYQLFRDRALANNLEFDVIYDGIIPEIVETDPLRLRQILVNLVSNAIKFTNQGAVTLVARVQYDESSVPVLEFEVTDTGIGIAQEDLKKIFDNFTQVDNSTSRVYGGTGLGLAISKRLAKILKGDIQVSSTLGEGSSFILNLPIGQPSQSRMIKISDSDDLEKERHKSSYLGIPSNKTNARILLAEDGRDNQKLVSQVLENFGARVDVVENGQEAYHAAIKHYEEGRPYDVVLMDMQMPVLDGYQATEKLRASGYSGSIIALTAHAMRGDREKCLQAGCNDYVSKPIEFEALLNTISQWSSDHLSTNFMANASS